VSACGVVPVPGVICRKLGPVLSVGEAVAAKLRPEVELVICTFWEAGADPPI
jgi:hypothetical protein